MKLSNIVTMEEFMVYCRMPVFTKSTIRSMRVGDLIFFGQYKESIPESENAFYIAEAWIERERGVFKCYATWTFPTKAQRGMIMSMGEFKIKAGGVIQFSNDCQGIREFALVSRYLNFLFSKLTSEEKLQLVRLHTIPLLRGLLVDSELVERKVRAREVNGKIESFRVDYKNYEPTHQLAAIVNAGLALKQI